MATDIQEAIRRLIYEYISKGAGEVIATQEAVAASTTKTDKASLSLEKAFGSLERRYVETVRAQQDYQKVQDKVNAAVAQNPELQERANVVLAAAGKHFDNLASKGNFFADIVTKGFTKFLGPMALFNLALTGIGAAIGYMAAQWQSSSTTVEQAMEEQNRLMKESLKLIDAKTSAQDRMFAQSKAVTELQTQQSLLDLQIKLNNAMAEAIKLAERKTTTPTQVAGEMGEAPTGVAPLGPGYEKMIEAAQRLKDAWAQGLPGLQTYNDELAQTAAKYPELAAEINKLIQANQQNGVALEQLYTKGRAVQDALAGIATNAQMVAAGLGSIAQFNLNNLNAQQAAYDLERMANEMDRLADKYQGLNLDTAKQLELLDAQLVIAKARTDEERLIAQEKLKILQLTLQGKEVDEAVLIAAKERLIAEENITRQKEEAAKREAEAAERQDDAANSLERQQQPARNVADSAQAAADGWNDAGDGIVHINTQINAAARNSEGWLRVIDTIAEQFAAIDLKFAQAPLDLLVPQFGGKQYTSSYDPLRTELQRAQMEQMYGAGNIEPILLQGAVAGYKLTQEYIDAQFKLADSVEENTSATNALNNTMQNALSPFYSQDPRTTHLGFRAGVVGNPEWQVGGASNENPLAALLGAGATAPGMAGGGSFMVGGGYSANDNKIAAFPVASGEEVIVNRTRKGGQGGQVIHIDNRTIINGRVDADVFAQMKHSKYQQTQRMRAGLAVA